ncbi:MAG: glycosyltransferase family 4 protein [Planctomycetota bacterium]|jgi:glycosyltransferase involved in cell wall biosynthesis
MNHKLAYVLNRFPHGQTSIVNELRILRDAGADVEIVALEPAQKSTFMRIPHQTDFPVAYLFDSKDDIKRRRHVRDNAECFFRHPLNYSVEAMRSLRWMGSNFKLACGFVKAIEKINPTLVYINWSWATCGSVMYACRILGLPFVFSVRGTDIDPPSRNFPLRVRTAKRILTPSEGYAKILKDELGVPHNKIRVVPNSMDFKNFTCTEPARMEMTGPLRLLSVGTLRKVKRFEDLINSCALLRQRGIEFKCHVYGEGSDRTKLQSLIDRLNLTGHVDLKGNLPGEKLVKQYEWCDIYVHTSERESFCYTVVEAQASARPVVVTDSVGGIRQSVRPGKSATIVPVGKPQELAEALIKLANDPQLRFQMGQAGREYVTKMFSIEKTKPIFLEALFG